MHVLGAWARPRGAAVVWHFHDYAGRRALMARLLRRSCHRCAAIVANSRSVAEDAKALTASPAVAAGRLVIGSQDGRVYVLG